MRSAQSNLKETTKTNGKTNMPLIKFVFASARQELELEFDNVKYEISS